MTATTADSDDGILVDQDDVQVHYVAVRPNLNQEGVITIHYIVDGRPNYDNAFRHTESGAVVHLSDPVLHILHKKANRIAKGDHKKPCASVMGTIVKVGILSPLTASAAEYSRLFGGVEIFLVFDTDNRTSFQTISGRKVTGGKYAILEGHRAFICQPHYA